MLKEENSFDTTQIIERVIDVAPVRNLIPSGERAWRNIEAMRLCHDSYDFDLPPLANHLIVVYLGRPFTVTEKFEGRVFTKPQTRGDVTILPAGAPSQWRWKKEDEVTVLHLYVKPSLIHEAAAAAELDPSKIEIINTLGVRDANVERIGLSLLAELENENLGGRLYAETLATQLALQLLRGYSSVMQTPVREPSGGLPPAKLRRVFEYIHENLDGDLSLCELAATVEISPFHFARLFKSATGLTPNCYVTERRIERAENLLAETKLPLVEIANLVGFSSQAHFTTIFRRVTGRTPGAYRDEF